MGNTVSVLKVSKNGTGGFFASGNLRICNWLSFKHDHHFFNYVPILEVLFMFYMFEVKFKWKNVSRGTFIFTYSVVHPFTESANSRKWQLSDYVEWTLPILSVQKRDATIRPPERGTVSLEIEGELNAPAHQFTQRVTWRGVWSYEPKKSSFSFIS